MLHYLIRRTLIGFITLACVTFLVYGLIRSMPGDPTTLLAGEDPSRKIDPADFARIRRIYGLDRPVHEAYFVWLGNVFAGDLGRSFSFKEPVSKVIGARVGPTLFLSVSSLMIAYALAVPMGLIASVRSGKPDERIMSTLLYMLYSFPAFVAALLLQIYFYVELDWLPLDRLHSFNYETLSPTEKIIDLVKHAILPVTCYTYASLAYYSRFIRANMAEVLQQDYIRTARAKGVGPYRLVVKHAFRNTLIPMVTLMGLTLPSLLSGSVILEQIFNWPGMGLLFIESLYARDYPVIMGLVLMFSVLTLLGMLLSDVLYAVVDPRISYH
jgi:peptide/nickel transport system permease protein